MQNETILVGDTCVIRENDQFIAYCPFTRKIVKLSERVWEDTKFLEILQKQGLFNEPPAPQRRSQGFTSLTLFLTQRCNLSCTYCYARTDTLPHKMDWSLAKQAIDFFCKQYQSQKFKMAFHGGGEQTLESKLIKQTVAYCRALGYPAYSFALTTNGVIHPNVLNYLIENQFALTISIDGPPALQDVQRPFKQGKPSSSYVEATIQRLVEQNYPFVVRPTLTQLSLSNILNLLRYFNRIGVKKIFLQPLSSGRGCPFEETLPNIEELVEVFWASLEFAREHGMQIINSNIESILTGKVGSYCRAIAGEALIVTTQGFLSSCYEIIGEESQGAKDFLYGRIENQLSIDDKKLFKLSSRVAENMQECQTCFAKFICAGTCPMKAWRKTGNLFERDPYTCKFSKKIIPRLIRQMAQESGII